MAQREAATPVGDERVSIDRMTEHDLLEVVEIEQACGLSPWGWDAYHAELGQGSAAIMLVARADGESAENGEAPLPLYLAKPEVIFRKIWATPLDDQLHSLLE